MPTSVRKQLSQSKHDRRVGLVARYYENRGYDVYADISGYPRPETIGGYRPDVIAMSNRRMIIVEVETVDSVNSARDIAQRAAFARYARRHPTVHFRRIVV